MTKAIRIHRYGGPDELKWDEIETPKPGPGQALIRQTAVGLNFIDVYHRTGLYPLPALPASIGMEAAGIVVDVGKDVTEVKIGDRVAYAMGTPGSYSEIRAMNADRLVVLPDFITEQAAAAMMLQGMTAQYLLRSVYRVQPGDTILIHAAAGGVGLIACQWAKYLGATVIGTVGSPEKAELARAHGCDHTILYKSDDFVAKVRDLTDGKGVPVVYDSVGRETFLKSMDALKPRGLMVSFGQSSGAVPPIDPTILAAKGSLYLTRPTLATYTALRADLLTVAAELFDVVNKGAVRIEIRQTYPLADAAMAHRDLEERKTTGSTILLP